MDAIKGWVMAICFAAVAAGMAGILAPSGNLEKIYKFVISLFFPPRRRIHLFPAS